MKNIRTCSFYVDNVTKIYILVDHFECGLSIFLFHVERFLVE